MPEQNLNNALGYNLYRLSLLFRRELIHALAEYKMTPEQWQVMSTLWSTGNPLSQREIVDLTLKDQPTVSRIIRRLERDGWVKKSVSQKDNRQMIVEPTAGSQMLKEEVPKKLVSHFEQFLSDFPLEKKDQLLGLLQELRITIRDL